MSTEERINTEIKDAMRAKDTEKLSTLRMLKAAIENLKIEKQTEKLGEDAVLQIIQKQVKQRHDSIESFEKAGRTELADKEKRELCFLQCYLPAQLTDDELKAIITKTIADTGVSSKADMGKLMGALMPQVKGKADGKRVNAIVGQLLH